VRYSFIFDNLGVEGDARVDWSPRPQERILLVLFSPLTATPFPELGAMTPKRKSRLALISASPQLSDSMISGDKC
jgi:hypothetical protein